jgi:CHASE2 domain-containing sensor protein
VDALTAAALGPARTSELFGFVNLDEDRDGATRRGRRWFRDRAGGRRPSWAARAARALRADAARQDGTPRELWIDTRIEWTRYARISWRDVPAALRHNPAIFRDRLVLVGGDYRGSGDDYHRVAHRWATSGAASGLTLQALIVDTIGAGRPLREPGRMPLLAATALATMLAAAALLCRRRIAPTGAWLAAGAGMYLALSFPAFWTAGWILPMTTPLLLVLLGSVAALVVRRGLPSPAEGSDA